MKKFLMAALVLSFVLGTAAMASAVSILPGQDLPAGSTVAISGATLIVPEVSTAWSVPITGGYFKGTLSTWVYQDDTDKNLIFAYQVYNDADSKDSVDRLTAIGYYGFTTDMNYQSASVSPVYIDRKANGDTIGWDFKYGSLGTYIPAGSYSSVLWVETDAYYYTNQMVGIIDGQTVNTPSYGPAVPEPTTMAFLGFGLLGLGARKLRKRFKA